MRKANVLLGLNTDLLTVGQGQTRYWTPNGTSGMSAAADNREVLVPNKGQVVRFVGKVTQNNTDNNSTLSLVKNQGAGDEVKITLTFAAGETGTKTAVGSISVASGDELVVEMIAGAGTALDTITVKNWAIVYYT